MYSKNKYTDDFKLFTSIRYCFLCKYFDNFYLISSAHNITNNSIDYLNNLSLDKLDEANQKLKILINSCSGCNESVMLKLSINNKKEQTNSNYVSTKDKLDEKQQ